MFLEDVSITAKNEHKPWVKIKSKRKEGGMLWQEILVPNRTNQCNVWDLRKVPLSQQK